MQLLSEARELRLHGDQHMGALLVMDDGAGNKLKSFKVPEKANGWPRAWWQKGSSGKKLGNFKDYECHIIRMMAVDNPDLCRNLLEN